MVTVVITVMGSNLSARALSHNSDNITLIKETKSLKAPQALYYKWYLNGQALDATTDEISIKEAGTYRVEMINAFGETTWKSVTIAMSPNGDPVVVHLIGDSTVQEYGDFYDPRSGWGEVLQLFFDTANVVINNKAVGGTSSKSFYNSFWPNVLASVDSGDFVLIGFGINDNNPNDTTRHTIASTTFKDYLSLYVQETQNAGAYPVIVSTVRRNAWNNDSSVYNAYHGYPIASRELADSLNIPLIDLDEKTKELMEELRRPYCSRYWYMNLDNGEYPNSGAYSGGSADNVHFQEMGAIEMARLVTEEIQALSADPNVSTLIPHLRPTYEVAVTASVDSSWDEYGGLITRTASYPEGTNVTLKVRPEEGAEFIKWSTGSLDSLTDEVLIQFTMSAEDTSYTAHFYYPPRLEIISPEDGATYELGNEIILDVFAHQVSDTNSVVSIYDGADIFMTLDTFPYIDTLTNIDPGPHTFIAKAYDVFGNLMESPAISFDVDSGFPYITLLDPAGDSFYDPNDTISILADAYDSNGTLDTVKFYLNGNVIASVTTAPYEWEIPNPAAGTYTLYAEAVDNDGFTTTTPSVNIEVGPLLIVQEQEDAYCGMIDDKGTIDSNHAGHTGSGFVNVDNTTGTGIDYSIHFPDSGEYKFIFRYAATTTRPGELKIDGVYPGAVSFPATSDWTDWQFSSLNYTVPTSGDKAVSIIANQGSGLPNIDYMAIIALDGSQAATPADSCVAHAWTTAITDPAQLNGFRMYPVPANDFLMMESLNEQNISDISFYSLDGKLVKKVNNVRSTATQISCAELSSGLYMAKVTIGKEVYLKKFVIRKE